MGWLHEVFDGVMNELISLEMDMRRKKDMDAANRVMGAYVEIQEFLNKASKKNSPSPLNICSFGDPSMDYSLNITPNRFTITRKSDSFNDKTKIVFNGKKVSKGNMDISMVRIKLDNFLRGIK